MSHMLWTDLNKIIGGSFKRKKTLAQLKEVLAVNLVHVFSLFTLLPIVAVCAFLAL